MIFKTKLAQKVYTNYMRGVYARDDVLNEYLCAISKYMDEHKQKYLDIAKELLCILNAI